MTQRANPFRTLLIAGSALMTTACVSMRHETFVTETPQQSAYKDLAKRADFELIACDTASRASDFTAGCDIAVVGFNNRYKDYVVTYGAAPPMTPAMQILLDAKDQAGRGKKCALVDLEISCSANSFAQQPATSATELAQAVAPQQTPVTLAMAQEPAVEQHIPADQEAKASIVQNTRTLSDITDGKTRAAYKKAEAKKALQVQAKAPPVAANPNLALTAKVAVPAASAAKKADPDKALHEPMNAKDLLGLGAIALAGLGIFGGVTGSAHVARKKAGIANRTLTGHIKKPKKQAAIQKRMPFDLGAMEASTLATAVAGNAVSFTPGRSAHDMEMPAHSRDAKSDFGYAMMENTKNKSSKLEIIKVAAPRILVGLAAGGGTALAFGAVTTVVGLSLIAAPVTMGVAGAVGLGMLGGALSGGAGSVAVHHVFDRNRTKASYLKAFGIGAAVGGALGGALGFVLHAVNGAHAGVSSALHHGAAQAPVAHTAPVSAPVHATAPAPVPSAPHVTNLAGVNFNDAQMQHLSPAIKHALQSGNAHQQVWGLKEAATEMTRLAEHAGNAADAAQNFTTMQNALHAGQTLAQNSHMSMTHGSAWQIVHELTNKTTQAMVDHAQRAAHALAQSGGLKPSLG